ncbi:MAG: hypothetical protein DRO67_05480 [Candidatus Asgardarchaeum californiense]|nr:MAG: hypothetical protein DRO67_05480 [Candidatus Asgardarchaeum californiense]
MSESLDPRELIRTTIGTSKAVNPDSWDEQQVLSITVSNIDYNIPIYLSEESSSLEEPPFPFIDINLMSVNYEPHDIGATTRKMEAYLDVGIWFTANDNYDPAIFGKAIVDKLIDQVRDNQELCAFGSEYFINVRRVRLLRSGQGRQVVYHYVIEMYVINYD